MINYGGQNSNLFGGLIERRKKWKRPVIPKTVDKLRKWEGRSAKNICATAGIERSRNEIVLGAIALIEHPNDFDCLEQDKQCEEKELRRCIKTVKKKMFNQIYGVFFLSFSCSMKWKMSDYVWRMGLMRVCVWFSSLRLSSAFFQCFFLVFASNYALIHLIHCSFIGQQVKKN